MRGIILDRTSTVPLHRQLENALREAILSGRLAPGSKLLSIRDLRTHLGASRNTIVTALSQLHTEGYLTFARGVGTFVSKGLQIERHRTLMTAPEPRVSQAAGRHYLGVHNLAANTVRSGPFRPGIPDPELFPAAQFRRLLASTAWDNDLLDYPFPFGDRRLREAISERLQQTRGLACTAEQVVVTGGAQAAFSMIAQVLLHRNDTVVVEDPGYSNVRALFMAHGARIAGVPVDKSGLVVGKLPSNGAALCYITPSIQYPTGGVLSLERRFALLHWAQKHGSWLIEDDYGTEFNYTDRPQPALHGLDGGRRVIYVGTFSKVLTPALRLGYIVVPRSLIPAFQAAQEVTGNQPSPLLQRTLAAFFESGQFGRHVARVRRAYDERRCFAAAEFARMLGPSVQVCDGGAGLHFIIKLPQAIPDDILSSRSAKSGIIIRPLSGYFHRRPTMNGAVIGYAIAPIQVAKHAIATVASLV
jgi:GntR family transcriptional regulator / MocR family aminotransferase